MTTRADDWEINPWNSTSADRDASCETAGMMWTTIGELIKKFSLNFPGRLCVVFVAVDAATTNRSALLFLRRKMQNFRRVLL